MLLSDLGSDVASFTHQKGSPTMQDLNTLTRAELLDIYNSHAEKPLKGFKDHATAVARTAAILAGDANAEDETETVAGDEPEATIETAGMASSLVETKTSANKWSDEEWIARAKSRGFNSVENFRAYRHAKTSLRRAEAVNDKELRLHWKDEVTTIKKKDRALGA